MDKIIISFSGGRSSAYLAYKMQFSPEFANIEKHYVFANTGKELEETLVFVDRCDKEFGLNLTWVEAVINPEMGVGCDYKFVDFSTADRTGKPFDDMVKKFGIPNKDFPHCTRELKERPMGKWAKDCFGDNYIWALGMRADERHRQKGGSKIYPLITTWPTNERMVRDFWSRMPFDLNLKDYQGNCDLCWKKSLNKRLTIISENPAIVEQWREWESGSEYVFDRSGLTIDEISRMATSKKFKKAVDKHELRKLFPELELIDIDAESSCTCAA